MRRVAGAMRRATHAARQRRRLAATAAAIPGPSMQLTPLQWLLDRKEWDKAMAQATFPQRLPALEPHCFGRIAHRGRPDRRARLGAILACSERDEHDRPEPCRSSPGNRADEHARRLAELPGRRARRYAADRFDHRPLSIARPNGGSQAHRCATDPVLVPTRGPGHFVCRQNGTRTGVDSPRASGEMADAPALGAGAA